MFDDRWWGYNHTYSLLHSNDQRGREDCLISYNSFVLVNMQTRIESQEYLTKPNTYVRKRPLHWFIMLICFLFIFLLALESAAFVILGAWYLSTPRLQDIQSFSGAIYRREIGFGILLVVLGALGFLICVFGVLAMFSLRILLLRIVSGVFERMATNLV